jgi:L-alanine-DL-glutamate epimerase-like enolase superfamily enzyme
VPYARYGESVEGVAALTKAQADVVADGLTRDDLRTLLPAGAARNALDAALWDLEAKQAGRRAWDLADVREPAPVITCYTLSLGAPEAMEAAARAAAHRPLLKVKLGGEGDAARIAAVRRGAAEAALVVDANEAWRPETFAENLAACVAAGVQLIEQPLPAQADDYLDKVESPIAICADESLHDRAELAQVAARYDAINIKLDKTGGLTEALDLARAAQALNLKIMVGCMVGTSLAMAPGMLLTGFADFIDLDGPLLLARDREPGLRFEGSLVHAPEAELWG